MQKLRVIITSILIALIPVLLLSGCQILPVPQSEPTSPPATEPEPPSEEPVAVAPMQDITWELEAYGDRGSLKALVEDTEITAEFKSANRTVVGTGECNSYFADYEIDNDTLTVIPPIGATEMACPPPIMEQEQEYFDLLETAESFQIHDDTLTIFCSDSKDLVFTAQ